MRVSLLGIVLIFLGCTRDKGVNSTLAEWQDSTKQINETSLTVNKQAGNDTLQVSENDENESDCVFNNDYKGLTTDWLKEVGKTNFVWHPKLYKASIPQGQDTIYVSKGGCEHMGMFVELKLSNDSHTLADSTFWIGKALTLATEFGLTHFEQMLKKRKFNTIESNEVVRFEIEDGNLDDNVYYNGVEIYISEKSKVIVLSQYYN